MPSCELINAVPFDGASCTDSESGGKIPESASIMILDVSGEAARGEHVRNGSLAKGKNHSCKEVESHHVHALVLIWYLLKLTLCREDNCRKFCREVDEISEELLSHLPEEGSVVVAQRSYNSSEKYLVLKPLLSMIFKVLFLLWKSIKTVLTGNQSFRGLVSSLRWGAALLGAGSARIGEVKRVTKETNVFVKINLDGTGIADSSTGIPFLDHMLDQLSSHGLFDLHVRATGDIHIDDHHTNEDVALAVGTALLQALGDRKGINRFGDFSAPLMRH
ncbi:hypothetical protein POTOM_060648 [Populus tomentosa]|uniref:imidazoleglycerol-phosphate dehydratase n=1 Tax=Populus tomentosa TaxID=118781 RepID=A0A8X7XZP3_POPTO|nr:hypothetical protein POTOM_060648 [Populus tomentosa]